MNHKEGISKRIGSFNKMNNDNDDVEVARHSLVSQEGRQDSEMNANISQDQYLHHDVMQPGQIPHFRRSYSGNDGTYWKTEDFKELVACASFCLICFLPTIWGKMFSSNQTVRPIPYQQLNTGEYIIDLSLNEAFSGDTVSNAMVVFLGALLPLAVQISSTLICNCLYHTHATLCVYLVSFGLTMTTTYEMKKYVGYLRPIFYNLCQPSSDYSQCTGAVGDGDSARKSFPSGHASTSFCGLTLLSLYLHNQFGLPKFRRQRQQNQSNGNHALHYCHFVPTVTLYRLYSLLSLTPMVLALFIASSRVVDNRHWPADIVAGALLGSSVANFVHGLWFVGIDTCYET